MIRTYTFRVFKNVHPIVTSDIDDGDEPAVEHVELGCYDNLPSPPWVPREGEFFRFRDPHPPGRSPDHRETSGYVTNVVTCFYGTRTTIEVYIGPRKAA